MDDWSGTTAKSFSNPIYAYFASEYPLSLGEGLTIIEDDGDIKKLYAIAEKYGLVNLYIAHIPENLAEYYFKNLTLDASDEEVKSKVKSHEKRKLDASAMSPHELVEWAEQEAGSPYLRTPPIKPRRKGIEFPCLSLDGPIDVGGPTTWCDLVLECVVEKGDSLAIIDKECFLNNVVLFELYFSKEKSVFTPATDSCASNLTPIDCMERVSSGWKLRCLVPGLKMGNGEDFSYVKCALPLMYQPMAVKKTSFPEMESSGSIVVAIPGSSRIRIRH
ncbi:hypothetical protein Tco_0731091 [Tanacetum coccineum]